MLFATPKGGNPHRVCPLRTPALTPETLGRDFSSKSVTPLEPHKDGEQLFEEAILTFDKNWAKRLGNSERVEKWQKVRFFKDARREWLDAWKRFIRGKGLGSLFDIRAGPQRTLEPEKAFRLASLRRSKHPDEILRASVAVIYASACEGNVEFLKKINLALKSRGRRMEAEADSSFLAYNILCYWFAGLLWLMNDKAAWLALCEYTGRTDITKAAYRKACQRLGLKGYKDRMRRPAVLYYDPATGTYKYGARWTRMEPHLST
jgi:hypothetical protein